uniref:Uncharacterized protein n=1 Tax=Strigamia maritima TaxID=126957 RepID=T1IYW0_STRMM
MLSNGLNFWETERICLLCFAAEHTYILSSDNDHPIVLTLSNSDMACAKRGPLLPYTAAANPPNPSAAKITHTVLDSTDDIARICDTYRHLQECGFYYEGIYLQDAVKLLEKKPVGTFLVRDSADSRYLFALSVQTERGPTSIRVHYVNGLFRLDAEANLLDNMPHFECVLKLIDYYVNLSQSDKARSHIWLDQNGRRDLHIRLCQPLYCRVRSLQHLCRTRILKSVGEREREMEQLPVPKAITAFLRDYPYPL